MTYGGRCVALLFVLHLLGAKMHQIYHLCVHRCSACQAAMHELQQQCTLTVECTLCTVHSGSLQRSGVHTVHSVHSGEKLKGLLAQG